MWRAKIVLALVFLVPVSGCGILLTSSTDVHTSREGYGYYASGAAEIDLNRDLFILASDSLNGREAGS